MSAKYINLALQGGGSHGAFTWGVLDRLLEEKNLKIEGISGTSAGAINGALIATGIITAGRQEAQKNLDRFWHSIANIAPQAIIFPFLSWTPNTFFPFGFWFDYLSQLFSPYDINPFNYNPIQSILRECINFECLRKTDKIKIYVSATNVETNRIKVFENKDICLESLLASICLPNISQAVEWNEKFFWDGGFMGNPILEPLIYNCTSKDLMIVHVNPIERKGIPKKSSDISNRMNEVTFNASLMREIRNIVNIQKLSEGKWCDQENPYATLRLHTISDEKFMTTLGPNSKFNIRLDFLNSLKEKGRDAASKWLKKNYKYIGVKMSMDLTSWHFETPTTTCLKWDVND